MSNEVSTLLSSRQRLVAYYAALGWTARKIIAEVKARHGLELHPSTLAQWKNRPEWAEHVLELQKDYFGAKVIEAAASLGDEVLDSITELARVRDEAESDTDRRLAAKDLLSSFFQVTGAGNRIPSEARPEASYILAEDRARVHAVLAEAEILDAELVEPGGLEGADCSDGTVGEAEPAPDRPMKERKKKRKKKRRAEGPKAPSRATVEISPERAKKRHAGREKRYVDSGGL